MTTVPLSIGLTARIEELRSIIEVLRSGHPEISATVAGLTLRRTKAELDMLLMAEPVLVNMLRECRDQPAAVGSITRPAAARELARRSLLTAHERVAEARERAEILGD